MNISISKVGAATIIALLFHVSGFIAIAFFQSPLFIRLTPLNLAVSLALLIWTQGTKTRGFVAFLVIAFFTGFCAEWIGVHTGKLFGNYQYGEVLGPGWQGIPFLIGVNWFITIYCVGNASRCLQEVVFKKQKGTWGEPDAIWMQFSWIVDGAIFAVCFDWIIEPVAVKLGYWQWQNNFIPAFNYWSWFGISALLLLVFRLLKVPANNLFAVHLLLIQVMFFLLLRFF